MTQRQQAPMLEYESLFPGKEVVFFLTVCLDKSLQNA